MTDIKRFIELKEKVARLERESERASGALGQLMQQLKEEFDCESVEEAKRLEKKLCREQNTLEEKLEKKIIQLEKEIGDD
jgi:hypothetical protein